MPPLLTNMPSRRSRPFTDPPAVPAPPRRRATSSRRSVDPRDFPAAETSQYPIAERGGSSHVSADETVAPVPATLPCDEDAVEFAWEQDPTVEPVFDRRSADVGKGTLVGNRAGLTLGSGPTSASAQQRDHRHPIRRTGGLQDTGEARLRRCLRGVHTQIVLGVVGTFGVIDMRTALALCQCVGGATPRYYAMRVMALTRAQVLRRIHSADVNLGSLIGRSFMLVAGDAWPRAAESLGVDPTVTEWGTVRRGELIEQLAFAHFTIDRALAGWTIHRGEQWLSSLARLDRSRFLGARQQSVAEAIRTGRVRFAHSSDVLGLIPPTGTVRPALIVGGGAIPLGKAHAVLKTARRVAPLEIVCFNRSAAMVERVRRLVMATLGGAGTSVVTVLPSAASVQWRKKRQDLLVRIEHPDAVGTDPTGREKLRRVIQDGGIAISR